jgi:hypothetical protein
LHTSTDVSVRNADVFQRNASKNVSATNAAKDVTVGIAFKYVPVRNACA